MDVCDNICIFLISLLYCSPILISYCCFALQKQHIIKRRKYILLNSLVGYFWMILFYFIMNLLQLNKEIAYKIGGFIIDFPTLSFWILLSIWVLPIFGLNYMLSKNKIVNFGETK